MSQASLSPVLVRAITRVMRPLVRLMLASGITYPFIAELLKGLFVEVADKEFWLDGKPSTDSRISLLTGVHRKDVRRLRNQELAADMSMPEVISVGAQLVTAWLEQPPFVDADGRPRPLPRLSSSDGEVSFERLVMSRSKDIRARVVLDEWLRLGIVSLDDKDRVVLSTEAFIPKEGLEEKLYFFAHNLHDHAAAATHNLVGDGAPWLERSVYYDALSQSSIEELNTQAQQLSAHMLKTLNHSAMRLETRDAQDSTPHQRFTCGVYFYSEPTSGETTK
ncbi:DUF6502 family protein [Ferrigenium sp. UT5]|uniref:DUF6502 family protein n=1 Tax=Ferrigenium sp. UT5 TaxID=3242105 RepID=UPI00354D2977